MGVAEPEILFAKVMHGRLIPRANNFRYGIYYVSLPLSHRGNMPLSYNRVGTLSFHDKDHGPCDGSDLESWARDILAGYGIDKADGEITLICMPRVLGYVFNPVSFWLCHDKAGEIRAVICEVHNTFGEHHSYLCAHSDQSPITKQDVLKGAKLFHVSPFLEREGEYSFRFDSAPGRFGVWIDYYNAQGQKQLVTSLIGEMEPMSKQTLARAFWRYPLVTLKSIALIHWQAIKLLAKGIRYISKPAQKQQKTSATQNLTKI